MFKEIFFDPLLKALIFFYDNVPGGLGTAVILLTVLVKTVLLPFNNKALRAQKKAADLKPKLDEIQEKHKDDKEKAAKETMALYKEEGMNPFSSILLLLVQMPILIALYQVFREVASRPEINTFFLGLDLGSSNIWLASIAAIAFFVQGRMSSPSSDNPVQQKMQYIYPVMIFFISYKFPGALSLYLIVSSIFSIIQLSI